MTLFDKVKEIIIDCVNVAGWTDEEVYYKFEHHTSKAIKQIAFDLYKQLKRLEQENKELKKQIESQKGLITVGGKQQYQYLQEIDKLQQENKELKEMLLEDKTLDEHIESLSQEDIYRSALEEIKNSVINYLPKENYKFARSFNPEEFELLENILTKINEVINEVDR